MPYFLSIAPQPGAFEIPKNHWCSTMEVATAVATDIARRFDSTVKNEQRDSGMRLDFGGAMLGSWEQVTVGNLSFYPHQLFEVMACLDRALEDGPRTGGYVKLHGLYTCICLTFEEATDIRAAICSPIYAEKEQQALDQWEKARDSLKNCPYILLDEQPPGELH